MKRVYPHYGGADIHRFAGAGNRAGGAGLMNFLHWKLLFAIIGAMSLLAQALLIFNMPETVTSQGRGFVRERYFPSLSAPLNSRWCSRARWRCHSVTCR